jgi:hypothetical protein
VYCCLGRIILLIVYVLLGLLIPLSAGEVKSTKLDQEAMEFEAKAKLENDPLKKKYLNDLASIRREDAKNERKSHYINKFNPLIKNPPYPSKLDSTLNLSENIAMEGTWEVTFGLGSGIFTSSRGQEFLKSPEMIAVAGGFNYSRTSLNYDNFEYYNSYENRTNYAVNPFIGKLRYTHNTDKFGFTLETRAFVKDTSYQAWNLFQPNSSYNALQESKYYWSDIKLNYFLHERLDSDQSFQFLFGLRLEGSSIIEKAVLPNISRYRQYNENMATLGPNLGMSYKKNFFGIFQFTAGSELSLGFGTLEYDSLVLRDNRNFGTGSNFSRLEMKDPIFVNRLTIEAYTKFDLVLTEKNRLGIGLTYLESARTTRWENKLPIILSNDIDQVTLDYYNFIQRNTLYNLESKSDSPRSQFLRLIQLEYSYVF